MRDLVIFLTGIGVGALTGILLTRKKYAEQAKRDIQSVTDTYDEKFKEKLEEVVTTMPKFEEKEESPIKTAADLVKEKGYISEKETDDVESAVPEKEPREDVANYNRISTPEKEQTKRKSYDDIKASEPYIIDEEEFDKDSGQELICATYYEDGIVCEDHGDIIESPETAVGIEALDFLDENPGETVYVRNEWLGNDYEIVKDSRTYEDAMAMG